MNRNCLLSICIAAGSTLLGTTPDATAGDGACSATETGKVYGMEPDGAGPQAGARFGFAVDIDAGAAIIGAFLNDSGGENVGRVSMYRFDGNSWNIETTATPQPSTLNGYSGNAVAMSDSGSVAIVGGQSSNASGPPNSGAAWVFRYVPADGWWVQEDILLPDDTQAGDLFGFSVASAGTWAVIGAPQPANGGNGGNGKAYVFTGPGNWSRAYTIIAPDGAPGDQFGISVAQANDVIVIGADNDDDMGQDSGSAYVYRATGGQVDLEAKLTAPDGFAGQVFGHSVDADGDTIIVGAHGGGGPGRAYVFRYDGSSWQPEATLTPSDGQPLDLFGWDVSIDGDTALITALLDDHSGRTDAGSAYMFTRSGSAWTQCSKITAADPDDDDTFGRSAALSGSDAIVGADLDDDFGPDSGSAYMFGLNAGPCNAADLAPAYGVLDLSDVVAFIAAFVAQDPAADLSGDGLFGSDDVTAFINAFFAGCF